MSSPSDLDELRARVAELEAENSRLKAVEPATVPMPTSVSPAGPERSRVRSIVSATMIVVALLLAPLAVVAGFARIQLTDTDAFVATFAPLADDPSVQADIETAVVAAIEDSVDIEGLTSDLFDGLGELDLPDRAVNALALLEAPAVNGIRSLIDNLVNQFVTSDAFSETFRQALTVSHTQLVAAMSDDPNSALDVTAEGGLVLNLGPIIEEVKNRLVDRGLTIAENIPAIDRSIVLAQSESIRQAQLAYDLVVAVGTWLPFVALALLAGGVLIAVRHRATLMRVGIALGALMLVLWAILSIGRVIAVGRLAPEVVSFGTATLLYNTLVDQMTRTTIAVGLLGVIVALVALFTGPTRFAGRVRSVSASTSTAIREAGERHGLTTGRFGRLLDRYYVVALALVAAIALAVIAFSRPLTPATVIWTCVIAVAAIFLIQVLRIPSTENSLIEAASEETALSPSV